jgi:hypothetical protein
MQLPFAVSRLPLFILVALSFVLHPVVILADAQVAELPKHEEFLPPAPQGQEWRLVWHDEFEGDQLDETKWNRLGDWKRRDGYWVQEDAYALLWTPEEYVFYVNDREVWRTRAGGVSQVPQFIKLTEEIGKWGGDIAQAELPDFFEVEYVRVYALSSG